ncbi:rhodanese-like domain-containing protein [Aeromicrobium sp.]|uniref:rhodanese-like domain-containing protein n=1 Tax=Aeromicrobium sp. TaxID=1871063 RepID=UPI001998FC0A|nr:rhodanese-like domain-containing protein [Aeromicrobium sp.]MBC7630567.1 rhodanese-like domain-containing protein [Aeromicrobium sp.]
MPQPIVNVEPAIAHDLQEAGEVVLLDVREDNEWEAGHAPGAVHVVLGHLEPEGLAGEDVVVVCRSGNRSGKAAEILAEAGINARNLNGGKQAWVALGLPVVTFDGTPGDVK